MELIRELVNRDNVRVLVREMLNYLVVEEPVREEVICGKIAEVVKKYAPSRKWEIETMFTMLSVGGKDVRDEWSRERLRSSHDLKRIERGLPRFGKWYRGERGQ